MINRKYKNITNFHYNSRVQDFNDRSAINPDLNQDIGFDKIDLYNHVKMFKNVLKNIKPREYFPNTEEVKEKTVKFCKQDG